MSRIGTRRDLDAYDYVVYTKPDGSYKALSSEWAYPDETNADFVTLVEACYTNRTSVGATVKFFGNYDIKSTLNIPTTADLDFGLYGSAMQNATLTAHADLGANAMIECNRASWSSPQEHTCAVIKELTLDPNGIATEAINLPFTMMDLDNIEILMDLAGSDNNAVYGGGAAGGTYPNRIGRMKFHHIGSSEPHKALRLWYDTCEIEIIGASIQMNSATQSFMVFDGEFYDVGLISVFHGEGGTMDSVIELNGVPNFHIGSLSTITSGAGSTINGILDLDATSYLTVDNFYIGDSGHVAFKDATSQANTRASGNGFDEKGTGSVTSGSTTDVITHGCNYTPTIDDISITFNEQGTNDYGRWWVDTITATQFTLNVSADPGASNLDFSWRVKK